MDLIRPVIAGVMVNHVTAFFAVKLALRFYAVYYLVVEMPDLILLSKYVWKICLGFFLLLILFICIILDNAFS